MEICPPLCVPCQPALRKSDAIQYINILRDLANRLGHYHVVSSTRLQSIYDELQMAAIQAELGRGDHSDPMKTLAKTLVQLSQYNLVSDRPWTPKVNMDGRVCLKPPLALQNQGSYDPWWWRLCGLFDKDAIAPLPNHLCEGGHDGPDGSIETPKSSTRDFIEAFCINMFVPAPPSSKRAVYIKPDAGALTCMKTFGRLKCNTKLTLPIQDRHRNDLLRWCTEKLPRVKEDHFFTTPWLELPLDNQINFVDDLYFHVLPFVWPWKHTDNRPRLMVFTRHERILDVLWDEDQSLYVIIFVKNEVEGLQHSIRIDVYGTGLTKFILTDSIYLSPTKQHPITEDVTHAKAELRFNENTLGQEMTLVLNSNRQMILKLPFFEIITESFLSRGCLNILQTSEPRGFRFPLYAKCDDTIRGYFKSRAHHDVRYPNEPLLPSYSLGDVISIRNYIECAGRYNINNMQYPFTSISDIYNLKSHLKPFMTLNKTEENANREELIVTVFTNRIVIEKALVKNKVIMDDSDRKTIIELECLVDTTLNECHMLVKCSTGPTEASAPCLTKLTLTHLFKVHETIHVEYSPKECWVLFFTLDNILIIELSHHFFSEFEPSTRPLPEVKKNNEEGMFVIHRAQVVPLLQLLPSSERLFRTDVLQFEPRGNGLSLYRTGFNSLILVTVIKSMTQKKERFINFYDLVTGRSDFVKIEESIQGRYYGETRFAISPTGRSIFIYDNKVGSYKILAYHLKETMSPVFSLMTPQPPHRVPIQADDNDYMMTNIEDPGLSFSDDSEEDLGPEKRINNVKVAMRRCNQKIAEYQANVRRIHQRQARLRMERAAQGFFVHTPTSNKDERRERRNAVDWQIKKKQILDFEKDALDQVKSLSKPMKHTWFILDGGVHPSELLAQSRNKTEGKENKTKNQQKRDLDSKKEKPWEIKDNYWFAQTEYPKVIPFAYERRRHRDMTWDRFLNTIIGQPFRPQTKERNSSSFNASGLEFARNLSDRPQTKPSDRFYRAQLKGTWIANHSNHCLSNNNASYKPCSCTPAASLKKDKARSMTIFPEPNQLNSHAKTCDVGNDDDDDDAMKHEKLPKDVTANSIPLRCHILDPSDNRDSYISWLGSSSMPVEYIEVGEVTMDEELMRALFG